jgi:2',3'-cyclic-nucleotide 2'-phosphodiesterase (5'-nucleotidase family)
VPAASGAFPQLSRGVAMRYNPIRAADEQDCLADAQWRADCHPSARYRVATSKFLRGGGDNCSAFAEGATVESHEVRIAKAMSHFLAQARQQRRHSGRSTKGRIVAIE